MPSMNYICNVKGVPITWFEIESWYTQLLIKDKTKAEKIGDPYRSEIVCEKIAHILYNEMTKKIYGRHGILYDSEKDLLERKREKLRSMYQRRPFNPIMTKRESSYHEDKWSSQSVFQKIMKEAKRKAYEQQYGTPHQNTNKQNTQQQYVPPVLPEPVKWRILLEIPTDKEISEKLIKVSFRKMTRKYHPDLPTGNEDKMKEIIEARNAALKEIGVI